MNNAALIALCTLIASEQDAVDRASRRIENYRVDGALYNSTQEQHAAAMARRDELVAQLRATVGSNT